MVRSTPFCTATASCHDLGSLAGDGYTSNANGINDAGQVVGWSDAATSSPYIEHAFRYSGGTMQDLGSLTGENGTSEAYGINNAGRVVGWSYFNPTFPIIQHPFLYSGTTMQDLGTLPGPRIAIAYGINAVGQVVGCSFYDVGTTYLSRLSWTSGGVSCRTWAAWAAPLAPVGPMPSMHGGQVVGKSTIAAA